MFDPRRSLLLVVLLLAVGCLYAPGFTGYWLGDDFSHPHRAYVWAVNGEWGSQLWRQFFSSNSVDAAFFRPLIMASVSFDYWHSGTHYAGWYVYNFCVHLLNTLLIAVLVGRMAGHAGLTAGVASVLAAGLFGASPLLAEGVFWVSARSDSSVTLLSLLGFLAWVGKPHEIKPTVAWLPICLLPALLFKESAALVPLQVGLVWLVMPQLRTRRRLLALIAAAGMVALYLIWRAILFGNAWQVYGGEATPLSEAVMRLPTALASVSPWLRALVDEQWSVLLALFALIASATMIFSVGSHSRRLALALFAAGAGAILVTLLNLGGLVGTGEGGRLFYSPMAWLAMALGVLCARPSNLSTTGSIRLRQLGSLVLMLGIVASACVLHPQLERVWAVQSLLRQTASALPQFVRGSSDAMVLLLPETVGSVVAMRNGQAALVLRPLQSEGLIDRAMPTLPRELVERHGQYATGLLNQLQAANLQYFDPDVALPTAANMAPRWPTRIGCWSSAERQLIAFPAPADVDAMRWAAAIIASARSEGCLLE